MKPLPSAWLLNIDLLDHASMVMLSFLSLSLNVHDII